jgi:hypothetical protein
VKYEFKKSIETALALFEPDYASRCQVFSFCYLKGRLLAVGRNSKKTHPLNLVNVLRFDTGEIHRDKGCCAELSVALKIKKTTNTPFSKITIINVRLDKNKNIKMSRPCNSCNSLISYLKPKNVFYTNNSGQFEEYLVA